MNIPNTKSVVAISFYLPQFHPTPENDLWWGKGFTEWSQVDAWTPFYKGHRLRRPVSPLGEYCLLDPEVFDCQMDLASSHGITGFAVWDYWFGNGDRLLEKPLELVLKHKINFKFCIAWANHSWMNWEKGLLLKQQLYLGARDYEAYFRHCARHFASGNYIKVDRKPLFVIHDPSAIPDLQVFVECWHKLARDLGFEGMYFIGERVTRKAKFINLLDGCANSAGFWTLSKTLPWNFIKTKLRTKLKLVVGGPQRFDYWNMVKDSIPADPLPNFVPTVFTGWDTTARHGRRGVVFDNLSPQKFARHLAGIASHIRQSPAETNVVLIKSWNEWAEGNVLEPDNIFGTKLLEAYREFAQQFQPNAESQLQDRAYVQARA